MCEALAKANLAPKNLRGSVADMTMVVMTGLEVGLPPMASLRLYTTWDGVPRLMAEGVRAIILQSQAIEYFEVATCDDAHATWVGKRRGRPEKSATWTIERAKKAGLTNKDTWSKYPQDMLNARASMQLGRLIAPDVVAGMVSREEANDGDFMDVQAVEQPKFVAPPLKEMAQTATVWPVVTNPAVTEPTRRARKPADPSPTDRPAANLDAAMAKVEEKSAERPTPEASANSTSPAASSSSSTTDRTTTSSSPTADPFQSAREAVETRDKWGQPVADPVAKPPQPEDFGAEPEPSAAPESTDEVASKINQFETWLRSCTNQREMASGFQQWAAWTREMSDKHKDERFRTGGELAIRMKDSWARRKAQVPA